MTKEQIERAIEAIEVIQMALWHQRKDHNGNVLEQADIKQMQAVINILLNLKEDPWYIIK